MTSPSVTKLPCLTATVRVVAASVPQGPQAAAASLLAAAAWDELCRANPRLHDGEILNVHSFKSDRGTLGASVSRYRDLAAQGCKITTGPLAGQTVPDLGVWLLGIKAFITAAGTDGREQALILRRSANVRMYPNMWEIGPGGGVELPVPRRGDELVDELGAGPGAEPGDAGGPSGLWLSWSELLAALAIEAQQEIGVSLAECCAAPELLAVYQDHAARSFDIIAHCRWTTPVNPTAGWCQLAERNWEYSDAAWLARPDAAGWIAGASDLSPLARAVLAGWAGQ